MTDAAQLNAIAAELRLEIVDALNATGGGHYGGSLSVLDILISLYHGPARPPGERVILSKGHAALALYAVLKHRGLFDHPLETYARLGSPLQGHPDMARLPGIDFSSGSLGQGLSIGLGMAMVLGPPERVWVILGDGECQEGQVWEAAMLAARYRTTNLIAIVDANGYQEVGFDGPPIERLAEKWSAFGWSVREVDGHDYEALDRIYHETIYRETTAGGEKPHAIIAHTIKGKGFRRLEADPARFHCATLSEEMHREVVSSRYDAGT